MSLEGTREEQAYWAQGSVYIKVEKPVWGTEAGPSWPFR